MLRLLGALWHAGVLATLCGYLLVLIRNLRFLRRLEDEPPAESPEPHISVLIPARNEAGNLPACLESLLTQDYPGFDVTVLDDHSEDATAEIVASYAARDARLSLVTGTPMPEGWFGKPWACQQLAERAEGEILLFVDADTWFEPQMLRRTAGLMRRERPGLLSVLPHQVTRTFVERVVIPGLYMAFFVHTPGWRIGDPDYPDVSAANGQFMCFDAGVYRSLGGHDAVRDRVVEDIAFASVIKHAGERLAVRSATELVHCRMYGSWREVIDGFSKSVYGEVAGRFPAGIAIAAFVLATQVFPPAVALTALARGQRSAGRLWLPLTETGLLMSLRLMLSARLRFLRRDAVLAPLTGLAAVVILIRSVWWARHGRPEWKGRSLAGTAQEQT